MGSRCWVALCALLVLAATKECRAQTEEEDEKRPYKFAFSIEGYQHRSEQKDEKGIIMGEFGFVTGDGVYHVTVYATDENGDFKILKMKNYYVGLPGEGTTAAPSRAPPLAPTTQTTASPAPRPSTTTSPIIKHLQGLMGCSGCIVPDKNGGGPSTHSGEGLIDERFGGRPAITGTAGESPRKPEPFLGGSEKPGFPLGKPAYNEKPQGVSQGFGGGSSPGFGGGSTAASPGKGQQGGGLPQPPAISQFGQGNIGQRPPLTVGSSQVSQPQGGSFPAVNEYGGGPGSSPGSSGGTPGAGQYSKSSAKTPSGSPGSGQFAAPSPGSPTGSGQASKRGENVEGLPPGLSVEDMMALLYKFNYTLKYHGHHEKGYRSGDKEGGYFFNGRDGLGRNVEYLANEFGFQPNITLVDLGLSAPDTPKEPEEPNELKGNEFKWYYNR